MKKFFKVRYRLIRRRLLPQRMAFSQIKEVMQQVWSLITPLHGRYRNFCWLMLVYEAMQIVLSFSGSGMILAYECGASWRTWIFLLAGYVVFEEFFLRLDQVVVWKLCIELEAKTYSHLRKSVLAQFFRLDPAWHEDNSSGQLVGKVGDGISKLQRIIIMGGWEIIPTTIQMVLSLVPLLYFSPGAAALTVVGFLAFAWTTLTAYAIRLPMRKERHDLYELINQQFSEWLSSHRTIIAYGQDQRLLKEHEDVIDRTVKFNCQETRIILKYDALRYRIVSYLKHGIFLIWAVQLQRGAISVATFIFMKVLLDKLIHSAWRFSSIFREVSEASESARRLSKLMQEQPTIMGGTYAARPKSVSIELKNIWFSYGEDDMSGTIKGISCLIAANESIAKVGPSGAGKTTLVQLLMRLRKQQRGVILINGIPIEEWSLEALRGLIAYVPQDIDIFDATVAWNIALGKPEATLDEVQHAAGLAGIHDRIEKFPNQYDTVVGDRGHKLSGGEKQRVALARAFLTERPILILDEPTSAVDSGTEQAILEGIQAVSRLKKMTVIVIAHRLSTIQHSDNIIVLDDGRIIEQGSHDQLVREHGHYARQVELQSTVWETSPVLV